MAWAHERYRLPADESEAMKNAFDAVWRLQTHRFKSSELVFLEYWREGEFEEIAKSLVQALDQGYGVWKGEPIQRVL